MSIAMAWISNGKETDIGMESHIKHQDIPVPPCKLGKHHIDDDVSTAAPSPRLGDLDSPLSPFVKKRAATYMHKTSSASRDIIPSRTVTLRSLPDTCRPLLRTNGVASDREACCQEGMADCGDFEGKVESMVCEAVLQDIVKTNAASPPKTPYRNCLPFPSTPPRAPKAEPMPMLMRGLRANSATLVQEAIRAEPDIARFPFWDHALEPPLCFAVRNECKPEIIELLLMHGAELDAKDTRGRSPADILMSMRIGMTGPISYTDLSTIEKLLHVPPVEPGTVATTPWQVNPGSMCGLLDWRMLDMSPNVLSLSFEDQGFQIFQAAWPGVWGA